MNLIRNHVIRNVINSKTNLISLENKVFNDFLRWIQIYRVDFTKLFFIMHNSIFQGGARICPTEGLGSPTGGLDNRKRVSFCASEHNFPSKFPDRHEISLPDERAKAPPAPLLRHPWHLDIFLVSCMIMPRLGM